MSLYLTENVYSAYFLGLFPQETKKRLDHKSVLSLMSNTVVRSSFAYLSTLFGAGQIPYFSCELFSL